MGADLGGAAEQLERTWREKFDLEALARNAPPDLVQWLHVRGRAALSPSGARDLILITIRSALSVRDAVASLGLSVRAGVHTGELERPGADRRAASPSTSAPAWPRPQAPARCS